MKSSSISIGSVYRARVSGNFVNVRVDGIHKSSVFHFTGREQTVYDVTNLTTGRKLVFRSAAKFRSRVTVERAAREFQKAMGPDDPELKIFHGSPEYQAFMAGGEHP